MKSAIISLTISLLTVQLIFSQAKPLAKTVDSSHPSVVAILRVDSSGRAFINASGVLINPKVVLTAGHVNFDNIKRGPGGSKIQGFVVTGENAYNSDNQITFNWLKDVESHPDSGYFQISFSDTTGKTKPTMFIDIGLVFLERPILDIPAAMLPQPSILYNPDAVRFCSGVGFGYDKIYDSTFVPSKVDGFKRIWMPQKISLCNDLWLSVDCDTISNLPYIGAYDSGAPLLTQDNTVVGIWSWTDEAKKPCPYSSWAVRIDNPKVLAWIKDRIKTRLGVELN